MWTPAPLLCLCLVETCNLKCDRECHSVFCVWVCNHMTGKSRKYPKMEVKGSLCYHILHLDERKRDVPSMLKDLLVCFIILS